MQSDSSARPQTTLANFLSLDIRVGRIVRVEDFSAARNSSYKIFADFGDLGQMTTSAQVTNHTKQELCDRLIIGVVNLGPKRIAGFDSQFLLLGSYAADGSVFLLSPTALAAPGDVIG
jgi:tRNA-binding protein